MKIYSLKDGGNVSERNSREYRMKGTSALKSDHISTDRVEISREARDRFEASRLVEIDQARLKKLMRELVPLVRRVIDEDGSVADASRAERFAGLKRAYGPHDSIVTDAAIEATADTLLAFLP